MVRRRDELDRQIAQDRAEALGAYSGSLEAVREALEEWAGAHGHTLSWSKRKHAETATVDGAVSVVLGFPCEECAPSLSVRWGDGVLHLDGPRASFHDEPPPAGAVIAFVAALVDGPALAPS